MSDPAKRLHTLLTDRACEGLDAQSAAELVHLLDGHPIDPSYEQAAAGIELALLPHEEPLPANLHARLVARAEQFVPGHESRESTRRPASTQDGYMPTSLRAEVDAIGGPRHWTGPQPQLDRMRVAREDEPERLHPTHELDRVEDDEPAPQRRRRSSSAEDSLAATDLLARGSGSKALWAAYGVATLAVVILLFAAWLHAQRRGTSEDLDTLREELADAPDRQEWALEAQPDSAVGEDGGGSIVWSSKLQAGILTLHGLAPNEPTEAQYQLWIFDTTREGAPVDGGVFDVDSEGDQEIAIDAKLLIGDPRSFSITVERPGGVVVSTQSRVVFVAAPLR